MSEEKTTTDNVLEFPKIGANEDNTKKILEQLKKTPVIEKSYDLTSTLDVTFKTYTAFEHRLFLPWLATSMPENIRNHTRREFELGLRNLSLYVHKLGEETLSRARMSDLYDVWVRGSEDGTSNIGSLKQAAADILNNKLAALKTKNDIATGLISMRASKFYQDFLSVQYNEKDNSSFDEVTLEHMLFDSDQAIPADIYGLHKVEFMLLSNKVISVVEKWIDDDVFSSRAEFDFVRAVKYLAATIKSFNGMPLSGDRRDMGVEDADRSEEDRLIDLYEARFKRLMSFPQQVVVLLDYCRTHLARTLTDKMKSSESGLKN